MSNLQNILNTVSNLENSKLYKTRIMLYLYRVGRDTSGNIARTLNYSGGGYTNYLRDLADKGLIISIGRGVYQITEKGRALVHKLIDQEEIIDQPFKDAIEEVRKEHGETLPKEFALLLRLFQLDAVSPERAVELAKLGISKEERLAFEAEMIKGFTYDIIKDRIYLTEYGAAMAEGAMEIWGKAPRPKKGKTLKARERSAWEW